MTGRSEAPGASQPPLAGGCGDGRTGLRAQDVVVDLDARLVLVGDDGIAMPRKELDILAVLVGAAGHVVARQDLIDQVWGPLGGSVESLKVHIRRLRHRIEPDPHHPRYIRTVRGFGYIFDTIVPSTVALAREGSHRSKPTGEVRRVC